MMMDSERLDENDLRHGRKLVRQCGHGKSAWPDVGTRKVRGEIFKAKGRYRREGQRYAWSDCHGASGYGSQSRCGVITVNLNETVLTRCNGGRSNDSADGEALIRGAG